jgi:hypothetical protein
MILDIRSSGSQLSLDRLHSRYELYQIGIELIMFYRHLTSIDARSIFCFNMCLELFEQGILECQGFTVCDYAFYHLLSKQGKVGSNNNLLSPLSKNIRISLALLLDLGDEIGLPFRDTSVT